MYRSVLINISNLRTASYVHIISNHRRPKWSAARLLVTLTIVLSSSIFASGIATAGSWHGGSTNQLEPLRAAASNPHHSLDPSDYTISLDDSCSYVISSTGGDIKRIVYFDSGGNKHVVKRDHYGNRFGQDINLAATALAGVVEPGGTLFINVHIEKRRGHKRVGVIEFTDIPVCQPISSCPAESLNLDGMLVPVATDPLFIELSGNPDAATIAATATSAFQRCRVTNASGEGVNLVNDLSGTDALQFGRNGGAEQFIPITTEQFEACSLALGCQF